MDLEHLVISFCAISLGAFVKGVSGIGLPMIAMPIMAAFLGVPHAVAIMLIPIIVTNIGQTWIYRAHRAGAPFTWRVMPAGMVGIVAGTWGLKSLPSAVLMTVLACLVFAYVVLAVTRPTFRIPMDTAMRIALPTGFCAGALQGATGVSAPILVTYLHALKLERQTFIFAVSAIFTGYALAQLPSLMVAGIMTGERLVEGVLALIPIALFMPIGGLVSKRISSELFGKLVLVMLTLIAAKLVHNAWTG